MDDIDDQGKCLPSFAFIHLISFRVLFVRFGFVLVWCCDEIIFKHSKNKRAVDVSFKAENG